MAASGRDSPSGAASCDVVPNTSVDSTTNSQMEKMVREILLSMGEDPDRQGLQRTPHRVAKMYDFFNSGHTINPKDVIQRALFSEDSNEMVIVKDIEFYSLCEHHLLPFFGKAHVGYIPNGKIVGLSKIARVVDCFSRRLQVQERLTSQIAEALFECLQPQGVAVVMDACHTCMMMRGVQKQNSSTITSAMRGVYLSDARTRQEFLTFIGR